MNLKNYSGTGSMDDVKMLSKLWSNIPKGMKTYLWFHMVLQFIFKFGIGIGILYLIYQIIFS